MTVIAIIFLLLVPISALLSHKFFANYVSIFLPQVLRLSLLKEFCNLEFGLLYELLLYAFLERTSDPLGILREYLDELHSVSGQEVELVSFNYTC